MAILPAPETFAFSLAGAASTLRETGGRCQLHCFSCTPRRSSPWYDFVAETFSCAAVLSQSFPGGSFIPPIRLTFDRYLYHTCIILVFLECSNHLEGICQTATPTGSVQSPLP
jgi:hypothetical protein